jgi:hypothetical protein
VTRISLGKHRESVGRAICAALGIDPDRDWREVDQPGGGVLKLDVLVPDDEALNWQHCAYRVERMLERERDG